MVAHGGAGMPKGHKTRKTIEKEQAREVMREIIAEMEEMLDARLRTRKAYAIS